VLIEDIDMEDMLCAKQTIDDDGYSYWCDQRATTHGYCQLHYSLELKQLQMEMQRLLKAYDKCLNEYEKLTK
jgi:hypothetical protein